jgi:hypothetical protein
MKRSDATAAADESRGCSAVNPLSRWEIIFLVLLVSALLLAFGIKSHKEYFGHDDFVTTTLVSNSNLGEMLKTIAAGGETNPPLYFILQWAVVRCFGNDEFTMRFLSAGSIALAAVVVFLALRRLTGVKSAALAVALVFGLSRAVFWYMQWVRYYGLFVLLAALLVWYLGRIAIGLPLSKWQLGGLFVVHVATIYLHLFGTFFSGMFLMALVMMDWLRGRYYWPGYGVIVAAWGTFLLWLPALRHQLQITRDGTWTPRMPLGLFLEEPAMQTPLSFVVLLLAVLTLVAVVTKEREDGSVVLPPASAATPLLLLGLAWMTVPVAAWVGSHVIRPFYMQRYVAPCVIALVLLLAVLARALIQFAREASLSRARLPAWVGQLIYGGSLGFCLAFQPLRALQEPPKPTAPFVDADFGHLNLPMVFEDSMDYLVRAHYGHGREYVLLIDRDAAEMDDGYFTKLEERYFGKFRTYYGDKLRALYFDELPPWPEGFLVIDSPLAKTWEWITAHRSGLTVELLGAWPSGGSVYWVRHGKNP